MTGAPVYDHLERLTAPHGLFEHALFASPRVEHGHCLDDVARALVVTARQPEPSAQVAALAEGYLDFTLRAQTPDGRFRNRRRSDGRWSSPPDVGDHWGRALWALGTLAATTPDDDVRAVAANAAAHGLGQRSAAWHATAYAVLGAVELLRVRPGDRAALGMLHDAPDLLLRGRDRPSWPWPDDRLTYANAVLPESLIALGAATGDRATTRWGLDLLAWLLEQETDGDHLSPTPSTGRGPGDARPGFDQQPIEVTALAEACARAFALTGEIAWLRGLDRCVAWFQGDNDLGLPLYDPRTGAGYDALHVDRVNGNQGAESTLAALATVQLAGLVPDRVVR